jgi:hypothetical protein
MNVEIGTEAPIFLFWEYLFQIFGILSLQCMVQSSYTAQLVDRHDKKDMTFCAGGRQQSKSYAL